jgi:nitrate/nitrite transporter NarK
MTADQLSAVAGVVLSLVFSYIPGIKSAFAKLDSDYKRLAMGILIVLVAGASFALSCTGVIAVAVCDRPSVLGLVNAVIAALVANQATFLISPKPETDKKTDG